MANLRQASSGHCSEGMEQGQRLGLGLVQRVVWSTNRCHQDLENLPHSAPVPVPRTRGGQRTITVAMVICHYRPCLNFVDLLHEFHLNSRWRATCPNYPILNISLKGNIFTQNKKDSISNPVWKKKKTFLRSEYHALKAHSSQCR